MENKYGYKEIRRLGSDRLRSLCIKKDWYTGGTVSEYWELLAMADRDNITTDDVVEIVENIREHSSKETMDPEVCGGFTGMMFDVIEACYTIVEEV